MELALLTALALATAAMLVRRTVASQPQKQVARARR